MSTTESSKKITKLRKSLIRRIRKESQQIDNDINRVKFLTGVAGYFDDNCDPESIAKIPTSSRIPKMVRDCIDDIKTVSLKEAAKLGHKMSQLRKDIYLEAILMLSQIDGITLTRM